MEAVSNSILLAVGFCASFFGTASGGAGLLILPTLIFLGLSPQKAVGTAIFAYIGISIVGWTQFHRKGQIDYRIAWPMTVTFSIGCAIGSWLLLYTDPEFLRRFMGIFILFFVALALITKKSGLEARPNQPKWKQRLGHSLILPLGIHNGFMGGGTSTLVTYVLIFCFGETYLQSAGTRKPMFLGRTIVSSFILGATGLIHWPFAIGLTIGTTAGTYFGTNYALKKGNNYVRWILIIVTTIMAVKLLLPSTKEAPPIAEPQVEPTLPEQLEQSVFDDGARAALALLAQNMERDAEVNAFCHSLAHEVGHDAYDHLGFEEALKQANDICGSGYFHGVIERHFQKAEDVLTEFRTICNPDDGRCYHGVGHGLMFANQNDLPESVELCDSLDNNNQRIWCAEGVFMENFGSNEEFHQSDYKDPANPYYPCDQQVQPYKSTCVFYAVPYYLELHNNNYLGAIEWCQTTLVPDACLKGVGSRAAKYKMHTIAEALEVCTHVPDNLQKHCYEGVVSYIMVHYASAQKGLDSCPQFPQKYRSHCEQIAKSSFKYYEEVL